MAMVVARVAGKVVAATVGVVMVAVVMERV